MILLLGGAKSIVHFGVFRQSSCSRVDEYKTRPHVSHGCRNGVQKPMLLGFYQNTEIPQKLKFKKNL